LNSNKFSVSDSELDPAKLPAHVAIIMDGNGRWAKKRLFNRIIGHEKGVETVRTIIRACHDTGIPNLTLYAFSTENWQRPKYEVNALMILLSKFLKNDRQEMKDKSIRFNAIGQLDRLPKKVRHDIEQTKSFTRDGDAMQLNLALSYGGRSEIVDMVKAISKKVLDGQLDPETISDSLVSQHLYTARLPDPDLLIRTSGEMRISNFLLWQIAYSEIYITDTLWPDFKRDEFIYILKQFEGRNRRFGKVAET